MTKRVGVEAAAPDSGGHGGRGRGIADGSTTSASQKSDAAGEGLYPFSLGGTDCVVVSDGAMRVKASFLFRNAPRATLRQRLVEHGAEPDAVSAGLSGLVIRGSDRTVLVDTGTGGRWHPGLGAFGTGLRLAGVDPARVDTVLLTHGHPDHIGGILDPTGEPAFPNARYVLMREEWEFWTSEATLASVPGDWADVARRVLPPIAERVELVEDETVVEPGIRVIPAPGHTPGHMAVLVRGTARTLLCVGDAVGHPISVQHPEWYVMTDGDEKLTRSTRLRLYERAHAEEAMVFANHFTLPALGWVRRAGSGWSWRSERAD